MRQRVHLCLHTTAGRRSLPSTTVITTTTTTGQRRAFVDAPLPDDTLLSSMSMSTSSTGLSSAAAATAMGDPTSVAAASNYVHPLDLATTSFKMYGESAAFGASDDGRIFSSARVQSYDPAILFTDLRLQEVRSTLATTSNGFEAGDIADDDAAAAAEHAAAAARQAEDEANDAEMRSGRNKQVAGGAAAMAAAMLDSRRAVDGIALVPGHPLPVVFPRPDGLAPPLRFVKKFGPGGALKMKAGRRVRQAKADDEAEMDGTMYGEVMESDKQVESTSLHHSIVWKVQVLDEHHKPTPVKLFQHFREAADVLPRRVLRGLEEAKFTRPTLLQSAAIPQLMRGRDVVGVAPNGSGTTVTYAVSSIAVLVRLRAAEEEAEKAEKTGAEPPSANEHAADGAAAAAPVVAHPVIVVLCPSRQTVMRTAAMYLSLVEADVRVVTAYRGTEEEEAKQVAAIQKKGGCDVLICSPSRLHALHLAGVVDVDGTHVMAVDKMNEMLEAAPTPDGVSIREHLEYVLRRFKDNGVAHQLSLWCSEVVPAVEAVVHRYMSPLTVTVMVTREEQTNVNVRQILYALPSKEDRTTAIQRLYDNRVILKRTQVVVFCTYRETAEQVAADLVKVLSAPSSMVRFVHSGLRTRRRNEILKSFQRGDVRILVGTDVAMKRLDVEDLEHVVHYDLPASVEAYAQRVNHVGRSGRPGTSHTFLTAGDVRVPLIARFVEKQTGHALSAEIRDMVRAIEATGGEDSWDTPVLRMHNHAASNMRWRVRGRREMRQQVELLAGSQVESDKKPLAPPS